MLKTLEDLIYEAAAEAKVVMKTKKTVPPRFIGILLDGSKVVIDEGVLERVGVDFSSQSHKNMFALSLRVVFALLDAVQYIHYSEAWAMMVDKLEDRGDLNIEDDPRRFEIVHYHTEDKSGRCISAQQSIIRPAGKDPELDTDLVLLVETVPGKGRFYDVLNYELSEDQKKGAEELVEIFRLASQSPG